MTPHPMPLSDPPADLADLNASAEVINMEAARCPVCTHDYRRHMWGVCLACPKVYGPPPPTGMCQQRRPG